MPEQTIDPTKLGDVRLPSHRVSSEATRVGLLRREVRPVYSFGSTKEIGTVTRKGDLETTVLRGENGRTHRVVERMFDGDGKVKGLSVYAGDDSVKGSSDRRGTLLQEGQRLKSGGWEIREGWASDKGFHEFRTDAKGKTIYELRRKENPNYREMGGRETVTTITEQLDSIGSTSEITLTERFDRDGDRVALHEKGVKHQGGVEEWEENTTFSTTRLGGGGKRVRGETQRDEVRRNTTEGKRTTRREITFSTEYDAQGRRILHRKVEKMGLDGQPAVGSGDGIETEYAHFDSSTPGNERLRHVTKYHVSPSGEREDPWHMESYTLGRGNTYDTKTVKSFVDGRVDRTINSKWDGYGWKEIKPVDSRGGVNLVKSALQNVRAQLQRQATPARGSK